MSKYTILYQINPFMDTFTLILSSQNDTFTLNLSSQNDTFTLNFSKNIKLRAKILSIKKKWILFKDKTSK